MGPPSRSEWIMAALVLLAMFFWICGSNPTISLPLLGSNFINPTMVVFVVISLMLVTGVIDFDDIVAREGGVGGVLLLHLAADAVVGPERNRLHQMGGGGLRQAARQLSARLVGHDPAGLVLLLDPLFLFQHHLACGGGIAGGARGRHQHSRIVGADADAACASIRWA